MHGINNLSTMINPINPLRSSQPSTFLTVGTSTEFYCSECFVSYLCEAKFILSIIIVFRCDHHYFFLLDDDFCVLTCW